MAGYNAKRRRRTLRQIATLGRPPFTSRQILTFSTSDGDFATALSMTSGDTLSLSFSTPTAGVSESIVGSTGVTKVVVEFDAGNLLQLTNCTVTIDGSAVADNASISAFRDSKFHELVITANATATLDKLGQNGSAASYWTGEIKDVTADVGGSVTEWFINQGSTTVETPAVGSININWNSVTADQWATYQYRESIVHDAGTVPQAWVGADLVTNGGFGADTDWTKGVGWTIASGVGTHAAGTLSDIHQDLGIASSGIYIHEMTASGITAGTLNALVAGTTGPNITANGVYTSLITSGAGANTGARGDALFVGSIDDLSVKRLIEIV